MSAALNASVKSVQVSMDALARRDVIKWSTGRSTEVWLLKDAFLIEHPSGKWINVLNRRFSGDVVESHLRKDTKGFDWLSPETFLDVSSFQGKKCFHYLSKAPPPQETPKNPNPNALYLRQIQPSFAREAWIDIQTNLPVALNDGETLFTYKFGEAPAEPLKLSPKMQIEYDQFLKNL
jgi:hypothetical protein